MGEKKKQKNKKNGNKKNTIKSVNVANNKNKVVESNVLKQNKKESKSTKATVAKNEITNLVKIVLAITAVFAIFYGITTIVTNNKEEETPETGDIVIQYDEILLGTLFEQPETEYYVLVTKEDDSYSSMYATYLSVYESKENALKVYDVNLDNGFNKSYKAEESNINTNSLKELKFKDSTLLKIQNKTIVASYEGYEKTGEHLNSLIK